MPSLLFMQIGDRIRRARQSAGMSQRQLAEAVGVTHGLVGQWESHRKAPGRENLRKIAEVTTTDPAVLLGDLSAEGASVRISDPRKLALLRRFDRMSRQQQDNLLELLDIAADIRRNLKHQRDPAEQ